MTSRLILVGRNSTMPLDAAQANGGNVAPRYPATPAPEKAVRTHG